MIELNENDLEFTFPEVHPDAKLTITFQRTLRIPDDDRIYPLPPGLGKFPLRHVDDFAKNVPEEWIEHGGIILPMYQSEAMWLDFDSDFILLHDVEYPFAVKIATGKINAVSGKEWSNGLHSKPQDYLVVPTQPWLDGFCVKKGIIRQFVAMPLGSGYSAEEQVTGEAEHGGLQIIVYPMKRDVFEKRFPKVPEIDTEFDKFGMPCAPSMGLAPGGRMHQEIYKDPYGLSDWDMNVASRCFVHIANSLTWRCITGENPPMPPFTAKEYEYYGLPWFEYYDGDAEALEGSSVLGKLKSIAAIGAEKKDVPLPENESVETERILKLRKGMRRNQVRECEP